MNGKQHLNINGKVVRAAPHPKGGPIDPAEYYMVDQQNYDGIGLLAQSGETHRVVYWLDTGGFEPRICYEAFENLNAVARVLSDHRKQFAAFSAEDVISQIEKTLEKVRELGLPSPDRFQGMPYLGDLVWVVAPDRSLVQVKVTEIAEMEGQMSIIFGFHYKPNGEWFWTKEDAEEYVTSSYVSTRAKNVFLGEKS